MVKVKLNANMAGPDGTYCINDIVDLNDKEAKLLVEDGYAEYITISTKNSKIDNAGGDDNANRKPNTRKDKKLPKN